MNSLDLLGMGVRNLVKRKLRTFLTVLGVMIGTASIVVMVSLGLAVNAQYARQIEEAGDMTLISVYSWGGRYTIYDENENMIGESNAPEINDETILKIEALPGVEVATPVLQGTMYFKSGEYLMDAWECLGVKPEAMPLLGMAPKQGRLLKSGGDKLDVVFGAYAESNFRKGNRWEDRYWNALSNPDAYKPYVDVMDDKIRMSPDSRFTDSEEDAGDEVDPDDENAPRPIIPYDINVIGLLAANEENNKYDQSIIFDVVSLKELIEEGEKARKVNDMDEYGWFSARDDADAVEYNTAFVKCADLDSTKAVFEILTKEMGFSASYNGDWIASSQETSGLLQILLAAIGGVSLFVAAIGIANTMVMSIYERTREIGVMKVIGASIRDIKWLFLLESAMIGFFGGATGIGLSLLVSYLLNNADVSMLAEMFAFSGGEGTGVSLITPWLCGVALGFSCIVGLVSGYFPARRATKLSALSAIRTE